jgi:hypothetical protein
VFRVCLSAFLICFIPEFQAKAWQGEEEIKTVVLGGELAEGAVVGEGARRTATRVLAVLPGSDFGNAGVQPGDLVYSVWQAEGRWRYDYPRPDDLARLLFTLPLGEKIRFEILRNNGRLTKALTVKWAGPKTTSLRVDAVLLDRTSSLVAIPAELIQTQDLPAGAWRRLAQASPGKQGPHGPGLVFHDPDRESPFAKAGLRHGDIIVSLTSGGRGAARYDLYGTGSAVSAFRQLAAQERIEAQYMRPQQYTGKPVVRTVTLKIPRELAILQLEPAAPVAPPPAAGAQAPAAGPTLLAESLVATPNPVGAGKRFDLAIRFRASDAGERGPLTVMFGYRILAGAQTMAESKPVAVPAQSGALTEYVQHLQASSQPGSYVVEVQLSFGSKRASDSVVLRVE